MRKFESVLFALVVSVALLFVLNACGYSLTEPESPIPETSTPVSTPIPEEPDYIISEDGFKVFVDIQPKYYGADPNKSVTLVNNEFATNPTLSELKKFLKADSTDENDYVPGLRVCSEFAEELHNNAEKAGIRAGWVAVEFQDDSDGHALNVFETTNAGLVFVDSTGNIPVIQIPNVNPDTMTVEEYECFNTNDKRAYLKIGNELGFIGIDIFVGVDYKAYIQYINRWSYLESRKETLINDISVYSSEVEKYNQRYEEYLKLQENYRITINEEDYNYEDIVALYDELVKFKLELDETVVELEAERERLNQEIYHIEAERENLGNCRREPLGIVKSVEIYW